MSFNRIGFGILVVLLGCGGDSTTSDGGTDAGNDVATADTSHDSPTDTVGNDTNPCGTAPTTTFYVDTAAGNDANSGAAPSCAFKTITAALTASSAASHSNATINVAAGTYGAGETFPLVVNHGRSLIGSGATIQGSSATFNTSNTGSLLDTGTHFVTILAGDVMGGSNNLGATTVSGFTIQPQSSVTTPTANYLGLVCIAGNAPNTGATLPLPTPSLILKALKVGPNFDVGASLGSSPINTTGCNATITGSTFSGSNVGLVTGSCGTQNPAMSWPSAQVGDGQSADANTFTTSTIDVLGGGCGSIASFNVNHFVSGYRGIVLVSQAAQYFEILGNTFDGGSLTYAMGIGVNTNATAVISKLNGNTFTNISESPAADTAAGSTTGYAVALGTGNVLQAQGNNINNNDNGIYIGGGLINNFDFSSDGVTTKTNQIYCNSKGAGGSGNGYDLILAYTGGSAANFAGNTWDHATPTTSISLTLSTNGTDVVTGTSIGATLTGSVISTGSCTNGRAH